MNRLVVKHTLLDRGLTLAQLARLSNVPYDRLVRLVAGYRQARDHEVEAIAKVLGISPSTLRQQEGAASDQSQP